MGSLTVKESPGCDLGTFATCAFCAGDLPLEERSAVVSCVSQGSANRALWESLQAERFTHKLPFFDPANHFGALCALRALGLEGCRELLKLHTGAASDLES